MAQRLHEAVERTDVLEGTVERLGLEADLDEVERVLDKLGDDAGGLGVSRAGVAVRTEP